MDKVQKYWQEVIKEREDFWSLFFSKYQDGKQDVDVQSYIDNCSSRVSTLVELANTNDKETVTLNSPNTKVLQCLEEQSSESSEAVEVTTLLNEDQEVKDNSSLRVGTIEEQANVDEKDPVALKGSNPKVSQCFEEQPSESSEAFSVEVATPLSKEEQKNENFKPAELPIVIVKKVDPIFVREIYQQEENTSHKLSSNSHSTKKLKLFQSFTHPKKNVEDTIKTKEDTSHKLSSNSHSAKKSNVLESSTQPQTDVEDPIKTKKDSGHELSRNSHSTKKLKLFQSSTQPQTNVDDPMKMKEDTCHKLSKNSQLAKKLKLVESSTQPKKNVEDMINNKGDTSNNFESFAQSQTNVQDPIKTKEDTSHKLSSYSQSAKKFKLLESSKQPKKNDEDTMIDEKCNNFNGNFDSKILSDESTASTAFFQKLLCRRLNSKSKHVSSTKRFKLV